MAKSKADIHIFNQTSLSPPLSESDCQSILKTIARQENRTFADIELVFVDEEEIIRINREYLDHNYVTDIITFQYNESDIEDEIEGTLFCCASRIQEQAREFKESEKREFRRIFIHGLLHLAGYKDKSEEQQKKMTSREDFYLDQVT